jgi:hypothetical protein
MILFLTRLHKGKGAVALSGPLEELAPIDGRPGWAKRGLCRTVGDPEIFFSNATLDIAEAKEICMQCFVRPECRAFALRKPDAEPYGVWGGMDATQRRRYFGDVAPVKHRVPRQKKQALPVVQRAMDDKKATIA